MLYNFCTLFLQFLQAKNAKICSPRWGCAGVLGRVKLGEAKRSQPNAKKVDVYMKDGKLFFIDEGNASDKFEVIKKGNKFILK